MNDEGSVHAIMFLLSENSREGTTACTLALEEFGFGGIKTPCKNSDLAMLLDCYKLDLTKDQVSWLQQKGHDQQRSAESRY